MQRSAPKCLDRTNVLPISWPADACGIVQDDIWQPLARFHSCCTGEAQAPIRRHQELPDTEALCEGGPQN